MSTPAEEHGGSSPGRTPPRDRAASPGEGLERDTSRLARTVALAVALLALLLVWQAADFVLVVFVFVFGGVLVAVLLDALAVPVERHLHLPQALAVGVVVAAFPVTLAAFGAFGGPQVAAQIGQLADRLPGAAEELGAWLEGSTWGEVVVQRAPPPEPVARSVANVLGRVPGIFSTAVGALTNVGFRMLIGLYVAINPELYRRGLLHLVPLSLRDEADELLEALGHALRWRLWAASERWRWWASSLRSGSG